MPLASEIELPGIHGAYGMRECCASDPWHGSLDTGLLRIGTMTRHILQLAGGADQGLLSLIQGFDITDRRRLIDQFERAATTPTSFSFSTAVAAGPRRGQMVFCIGRSFGHGGHEPGALSGIFIFPHM